MKNNNKTIILAIIILMFASAASAMAAGSVFFDGEITELFGTHLKNTSARDMSQFSQDQEATTKVYLNGTPRRSDADIAKISHIPEGVAAVLPPRGVALRSRSAEATVSSSRLAGSTKLLATRTGGIFEMGSQVFERFNDLNQLLSDKIGLNIYKALRLMGQLIIFVFTLLMKFVDFIISLF